MPFMRQVGQDAFNVEHLPEFSNRGEILAKVMSKMVLVSLDTR